jgi:TolA-binding protein
MQGKVRITKRQIKEDKFTTFMLEAKEKLLANWQFYVIGIVIFVLILATVAYYLDSREVKSQEAGEKFARAMLDYRNGNNEIALAGLNDIVDNYGFDPVAEDATFLLGKINLEIRNYTEAILFYEKYLNSYDADLLRRAASLAGIGTCHENQTAFTEAALKYSEAYEAYPDGPLARDYALAALRTYLEAGDAANAKAQLDEIQEKYANSEVAKRATMLYNEKTSVQSNS